MYCICLWLKTCYVTCRNCYGTTHQNHRNKRVNFSDINENWVNRVSTFVRASNVIHKRANFQRFEATVRLNKNRRKQILILRLRWREAWIFPAYSQPQTSRAYEKKFIWRNFFTNSSWINTAFRGKKKLRQEIDLLEILSSESTSISLALICKFVWKTSNKNLRLAFIPGPE